MISVGDLTTVDIHTLLDMFLNTFMMSASFINEAFFLVKTKFSILGLLSSTARLASFPDYQITD